MSLYCKLILYLNLLCDHVLGDVGNVVDMAGTTELIVRHYRGGLKVKYFFATFFTLLFPIDLPVFSSFPAYHVVPIGMLVDFSFIVNSIPSEVCAPPRTAPQLPSERCCIQGMWYKWYSSFRTVCAQGFWKSFWVWLQENVLKKYCSTMAFTTQARTPLIQ